MTTSPMLVFFFLTLASIALSDCQSNNGWPTTAPGQEAELPCTGDYIGKRTRKCNGEGAWEAEVNEYCLPKHPQLGKGFVDFVLYIPNSNVGQIQKDQGNGIKQGFLSVYTNLDETEVSIYRIVRVDSYTSVQVRIATSATNAGSIYRELGATKEQCTRLQEQKHECEREHPLHRLEDHLSHNNENYHYLNNAGRDNCDIFIPESEGPYLNEYPTPPPTTDVPTEAPTETPTKNPNGNGMILYLLIVGVLILIIIVLAILVLVFGVSLVKKNKREMAVRSRMIV